MITDLQLAHLLADAADEISARHFRSDELEVVTKSDGSPVTVADQQVEEAISTLLAEHRPADGILGEEVGESGQTGRRWILDGIDGTHNFIARRTEWGTLIALTVDGEPQVGMITSPAMDQRWWAERGSGAWTSVRVSGSWGPAAPLNCSTTSSLDGAVVPVIPSAERLSGWKQAAAGRIGRGTVRPSAYGHSALRVASGEVDAAVHLSGGVWDLAAGVVIVEEAGGRFGDLWGGRRLDTESAVFSNAALFDAVFDDATAERDDRAERDD